MVACAPTHLLDISDVQGLLCKGHPTLPRHVENTGSLRWHSETCSHIATATATEPTFWPADTVMPLSCTGHPFSSIWTSRLTVISRPTVSNMTAHNLRVFLMASLRLRRERLWKSRVPHCRCSKGARGQGLGFRVCQASGRMA